MEEIKFDVHELKIESYIRNPDESKISLIVPSYCDDEIAKLWRLKKRTGVWKVTMKLEINKPFIPKKSEELYGL